VTRRVCEKNRPSVFFCLNECIIFDTGKGVLNILAPFVIFEKKLP
jgi:hypothetical protein